MDNHPNPERKWKNMRRMAWSALIAGLLFPLGVLLDKTGDYAGVAPSFYLFVAAIIGAYMGFSTWGERK